MGTNHAMEGYFDSCGMDDAAVVYYVYCRSGYNAAVVLADSFNMPYGFCPACESDMPVSEDEDGLQSCVICGQATTAPKIIKGMSQ